MSSRMFYPVFRYRNTKKKQINRPAQRKYTKVKGKKGGWRRRRYPLEVNSADGGYKRIYNTGRVNPITINMYYRLGAQSIEVGSKNRRYVFLYPNVSEGMTDINIKNDLNNSDEFLNWRSACTNYRVTNISVSFNYNRAPNGGDRFSKMVLTVDSDKVTTIEPLIQRTPMVWDMSKNGTKNYNFKLSRKTTNIEYLNWQSYSTFWPAKCILEVSSVSETYIDQEDELLSQEPVIFLGDVKVSVQVLFRTQDYIDPVTMINRKINALNKILDVNCDSEPEPLVFEEKEEMVDSFSQTEPEKETVEEGTQIENKLLKESKSKIPKIGDFSKIFDKYLDPEVRAKSKRSGNGDLRLTHNVYRLFLDTLIRNNVPIPAYEEVLEILKKDRKNFELDILDLHQLIEEKINEKCDILQKIKPEFSKPKSNTDISNPYLQTTDKMTKLINEKMRIDEFKDKHNVRMADIREKEKRIQAEQAQIHALDQKEFEEQKRTTLMEMRNKEIEKMREVKEEQVEVWKNYNRIKAVTELNKDLSTKLKNELLQDQLDRVKEYKQLVRSNPNATRFDRKRWRQDIFG